MHKFVAKSKRVKRPHTLWKNMYLKVMKVWQKGQTINLVYPWIIQTCLYSCFISHEQINDIIALISLTLVQTWNVRRQISSHWVVSPSSMCRMFILLLLLNFMGTSLCKNIRIIVCRFLFYIVLFHVLAENFGSRALMLKPTIQNN